MGWSTAQVHKSTRQIAESTQGARQHYVLRKIVQHACADGGGVCAKQILLCLLKLPVVLVPAMKRRKR